MNVRVRFAPSPTGYLHVGGLRTALYNYLFAKHHGGKIILRIEDTDRTRFVENATENLIENLRWAGIEFDESIEREGDYGPYIQSERFDLYTKYAQELIASGNAYYAFDTPEELEKMRDELKAEGGAYKYDRDRMKNQYTMPQGEFEILMNSDAPRVIRLKVPQDKEVVFHDIIRGEVHVHGKEVDDQILIKSDGFPTYHLANVVDDHTMAISHIIRGEEWLPSTPKHVLLYDAFGWDTPKFAHLPLLLNENKQKLSKRQGDVAVEDFRAKGYLRDAFVNFIALLGWNPTGDREIYTIDELIENFNLEKVNKSGAVFDLKKLDWINSEYIKAADINELFEMLKPTLENENIVGFDDDYIKAVISLFRERVTFIADIPKIAPYMFGKPKEFDKDYLQKRWNEESPKLANELLEVLKNTEDFTHDALNLQIKSYCTETNQKMGNVMHPLRLMITGMASGASMLHTMEILGKAETIERIEGFLKLFANNELN